MGAARIGNRFWIVAEHGMNAGYVRNIAHNPRVRLKLREGFLARWRTGTAHVLSDDGPGTSSAGLRDSCLGAERMRPPCACSALNCSRFGLIWIPDTLGCRPPLLM